MSHKEGRHTTDTTPSSKANRSKAIWANASAPRFLNIRTSAVLAIWNMGTGTRYVFSYTALN